MKLVCALLIGCAILMITESRESLNQIQRCRKDFQRYHDCRDQSREARRHQKDEAKRNLTRKVQLCFTENGCAAPVIPEPHAETTAEQECRNALRAAKRAEVQKCVQITFPNYVFAKPHSKRPKDHLLRRLLGLSVENCPNKQAVVNCRINATKTYRKTRFQSKCAAKAGCRVLMSARCQEAHSVIKYAKCKCKTRAHNDLQRIREGVAACQAVPFKPHKPHHACSLKGYCKEGYEFWKSQHPLAGLNSPAQKSPFAFKFPPAAPAVPQQPALAPQQPAAQPQFGVPSNGQRFGAPALTAQQPLAAPAAPRAGNGHANAKDD